MKPQRLITLTCAAAVVAALDCSGAALAASPIASFLWFPSTPRTGEAVSLASISTDPTSPILSFSWDLAGDGHFEEGGPLAVTTFTTSGTHLVRLKVTAADGSSSIAEQLIPVSSPPFEPMLPPPVVRIVGTAAPAGTAVRLLSVEAPPGAQITVECRGRSCPVHYASQATPATGVSTVTLAFRRFQQHTLKPGTVLEVRASKIDKLGKYTRFVIRRGIAPERVDGCLEPGAITPAPCPV